MRFTTAMAQRYAQRRLLKSSVMLKKTLPLLALAGLVGYLIAKFTGGNRHA